MAETKLEIWRQGKKGRGRNQEPVCTGRILALTFMYFKGHIVFVWYRHLFLSSKESAYHATVHGGSWITAYCWTRDV